MAPVRRKSTAAKTCQTNLRDISTQAAVRSSAFAKGALQNPLRASEKSSRVMTVRPSRYLSVHCVHNQPTRTDRWTDNIAGMPGEGRRGGGGVRNKSEEKTTLSSLQRCSVTPCRGGECSTHDAPLQPRPAHHVNPDWRRKKGGGGHAARSPARCCGCSPRRTVGAGGRRGSQSRAAAAPSPPRPRRSHPANDHQGGQKKKNNKGQHARNGANEDCQDSSCSSTSSTSSSRGAADAEAAAPAPAPAPAAPAAVRKAGHAITNNTNNTKWQPSLRDNQRNTGSERQQ
jgi:hypothetical protein